ncbi:hypothetical protein KPL71_026413 [Citrus sinensis]|uniref:Uncharacterized protein n=1 Tax=Citrus sinensis TaxID=2711 RepID=A0ACB8HZD0_CITSI|nr:hypothetical protein KPL71_026413 [Citrus sinensis]
MVQIFQPILHHALIYIDDILLFSGSHDEHRQLLTQFYDILQSHGIMLSAKKSTIATNNIEFLGMVIKDGHYQPGKHIAQELLHFPDQQLSKRQIQQFLGIINYIRDFIPHVDHYTHHLSALLKKKPPEWNADHTIAVTTLKQITQNPPPLKLITDGQRILQTNASDESWGAILLEELNDKEHFIAYASGQFSDTQKHYHSVFKEILAVKNGIKKFEYHLIGHHFLIRMDSSAFPNIFHFNCKTVPEKMLLRLKDWFSKYDFSVKHIKGSQNLIPDMLSRLSKPENPLTLFSTTYHFPIISMATLLPPEALTKKTFPFNKNFSSVSAIQEFARKALFRFFMKAYLVTDPFPFSTFHPENLFLTGLTLDPTRDTTEDVLWYVWCLTVLYATKLILPISPTLEHLLNPDNATSLTWTLLEWFSLIPWWRKKLQQLSEIYNLNRMPAPEAQLFTSVFIIHRPYFQHPDTNLFWTQDHVYEWFTALHIAVIENDIQDVLHNYLCQLNHQPPPIKDISHTSLGPQHDILMIPTPSAISKPKSNANTFTSFPNQQWMNLAPLNQDPHHNPPKLTKPLSIRTLISTRRPHPKEYIQSSRLDQCSLQATPAEQYVTLEIPSELISNWKREGHTHLHLGGIRLILTLHGRKGLPVTARLVGTVLTTLHAGSVLLTFYPNFNLSLQDPNLPTTLKVQVQIQGAEQISSAKIATLHHQLVYRLQNHALDLPTPEHHSDTLMVLAESDQIPTIIQIPRQISRHELIKLMPLEWISNYEQFHNNTAPIQTSESMFKRRQDGTVRMTFKPPPSAPQEPPRLSFTYSSMITAVQTAQEDLPITGFNSEGYPVYPAKHNGHFLWDAPGSGMCDPNCPCWDDWEEDDDYATTRKKKPIKKKPPIPCHHCDPKPPSDPPPPPAPLPIYRKELKWIAKHCKYEIPSPLSHPTPIVQLLACMMFSSTSSDYSSSFPPLEPHTDSQRNVVSKPFVPSPITSTGHLEPPKPFESIETKVDSITAQMQQIHQNLHSRIGQLESEKQRPTLFTTSPPIPSIGPTYHPFASMLSPIKKYDPSKLFGMTHTLFRDNPLPLPKPKPKPRPQPRPAPLHPSSLTIPGKPSPSSTPTSPLAPFSVPTQSKDKEPMHQFTAHTVTHSSTTDDQTSDSNLDVSDSPTETDTESSASTSDSEKSYADITKILIAQPNPPTQGQTSHTEPYVDIPSEVEEEMHESSATNHPPPAHTNPSSQKSSNGPWFTFDDLPSHKWHDRLNEMSAWIDLQMLRPEATTQSVLREFASRFTGALRDWFDSLGKYRQLQFVDLPEVSSALAVLHDQFLGDPSAVFEAARRDYLNMKCCSLNAKDLDFHYKRMSLLFYKLNGFNEPTLKHVFLASLPDDLQPNIQRQLPASNLSLYNISLGKIFQLAKTCLDKLCEQKQFCKELLKDKEPFRSACKKPYLQIKCHKKKDCDCSSKKKRHFQKFKTPEFSSKPRRSRKPYRFFRKKSSSSREFKRKQSSRCFICKRKCHYAKDCPNKREKSIRLVKHLQATTDYSPAKDELEFYFSEQDEPNDETVFALQNSSDSDSDQSQVIFHQQLLSLDTTVPIPSIKLQILPSKFQRPIPTIGLIDTGVQCSMLNPHILPSEYWTQFEEHFKAVNGKLFTTSLITKKPIGIQIFPNCVIWTKSMFKPFTDILKLYNLSETPQSYQDISTKLLSFCPESHSEFTHPNSLSKNKSFFIKLPFKLNEDINPTKATHPGMSPSDLLLAQQECSQLLAQGLIEPTSSQWACQAFYVEKHSEIVGGKKRLVIDYQPLNIFLQDDKFPLPRRQSMFTFLKNAQIFSKFDLKSGFWQLGIEPSERYKTAFCIPNAHFQWTVLPFGLKAAPSIFQKSMVQIFQPILHHALIYIDDILLFSGSHDEHRQLLTQFYDILQSHGIMLSAKKSTIATNNIEFLGMVIKDGHYQPGKHIAQELLHFPDQQLSKRQIQQFLGIINYIRDFIPHVDHYTHHLSALLKKKPLEWNADHTIAVTTLKQIAQNPPPLKLITDGKRILQTDASDESWGAILLEELNDKEYFIAYASGQFSDTQKHYHSVFKEILAVKNGIKKFEYHLIGHHFLIRMDSSAFPNIFHFKGKTVPEKMLLRLKDWFSKYDFSVKHIKGSQNLIPDMLSRLSKPENPLTLFSTTYHFPIISMATSLPPEALTKKTFPFNKNFSSVFAIQEFARKALFRFFMKAYLVTDPFPFSTFHPENLFLTGLTVDPSKETTEDVLWYVWCLTVLYTTKLILPISFTLEHLLNPDNATSLTWTLLEWFSPIPWWRKKLQQLLEIYNLDRMPAPEAQMFTSVFIIHRPYFQHPDTNLFWTQDQEYDFLSRPVMAFSRTWCTKSSKKPLEWNQLPALVNSPPPESSRKLPPICLAYFDIKALIDGDTFVVGLAIREQYSLHKMWIDIKDTCCGYPIKDANEVNPYSSDLDGYNLDGSYPNFSDLNNTFGDRGKSAHDVDDYESGDDSEDESNDDVVEEKNMH